MHDRRQRILVVEDESLVREVMVEVLTDAGFEVVEASSGAEALHMMDDPDCMDMVVTDLNMPGVDGLAVAYHARRTHAGVPVLFVTARPDLLRASPPPEPVRYLSKPFALAELTGAVSALLSGEQGSAHRVH